MHADSPICAESSQTQKASRNELFPALHLSRKDYDGQSVTKTKLLGRQPFLKRVCVLTTTQVRTFEKTTCVTPPMPIHQ